MKNRIGTGVIRRFSKIPNTKLTYRFGTEGCGFASLSILAALSFSGTNSALALEFGSQSEGWLLSFQAPQLQSVEYSRQSGGLRYFGRTQDGAFISLHLESVAPLGATHRDCRNYYWISKAIPNGVDLTSVREQVAPGFEAVSYDFRLQHKGRTWSMPNRHLYFSVNDQCADLHMGASPNYSDFDGLVRRIANSLKVNQNLPSPRRLIPAPSEAAKELQGVFAYAADAQN